jgi:hypothetical protein
LVHPQGPSIRQRVFNWFIPCCKYIAQRRDGVTYFGWQMTELILVMEVAN